MEQSKTPTVKQKDRLRGWRKGARSGERSLRRDPRAVSREPERGERRRSRWLLLGAGALLLLVVGLGLWRGRLLSSAKRPAASAAAIEDPRETRLRQAVEARPDDPAARMELGQYYEVKERPFEALWEYMEARRVAPPDPDLALRAAAALREGGVLDLAAAQLTEALRARPGELEIRRQLADLYLAIAEPWRARAVLEARRAEVWQDVSAVITLGRTLQAEGDTAGAVDAFKRSLALTMDQHEAWYRLGRAYLSQEKHEEARDALLHAVTHHRIRPEYPFYVGMTYLKQNGTGDLERAIGFFKDALAVDAQYAPAYFQYGVAEEQMGRRSSARSRYAYAMLADSNYAEPNLALGRSLAAEGKASDAHRYLGRYYDLKDAPAEAVREFQAMATAAPDGVEPVLLIGQVYIRTQQDDKAVAATEAALKRRPDDLQLLERLAVLKINRGDRSYARRLLHHWLKLDPKASRACWLLGRCDFGDLRWAAGVEWLEKAVARAPRNPHYLGFLGVGLMRMGTPESRERAAKVLAQAVAVAPEDSDYRDLYGQALQRLGRYEAARRQFLQALNAEPTRVGCFAPLTQLAWRLNRPGPGAFFPRVGRSVQQRVSEEKLFWPQVWEQPEDVASRLRLARLLCRIGDLPRARVQLEQAVRLQPDAREARQLLATVRRAQEVQ
jgi:tetratricopeptide (TPR) repeat protein